ncbi:MAG: hypothetical protein ACLQVY_19645 [Limisphaerales bacterium]
MAVLFWLYALWQLRMYFIYTGRIHSQTIGDIDGGPTLRAVAVRSAVASTIYGFLVLFIRWPRLLTYICVVWMCVEIVDAALGWYGRGVRGSTGSLLNLKGRSYYLIVEGAGVAIRAVLVGICVYFFGF